MLRERRPRCSLSSVISGVRALGRRKRSLAVASLLGLFSVAAWSACSPVRAYEAALVLADMAAGEGPSRLKATTPAPVRESVDYRVDGRARSADVYRPGEGRARAGLVLVPGAVPEGRHEPRIVAFAQTLARAGFAVLVPEMTGFTELTLQPRDIREVADAFAWLAASHELAPDGRAGMAALSYAVGPVVLAALDERIRERVRFILAVGGYHSMTRALRFLTTGWFEHAGRWHSLEADPYGQLVLALSARPFLNERDRAVVEAMVERRMADPGAALGDLAAALGVEGRAVYALVTNRDRDRFSVLFEAMPAAMKRDLNALDPASHDLTRLTGRLILVHGRNDRLIPYSETLALANAVGQERARVFLIHRVLGHVDLSLGHVPSGQFWREEVPDVWRMGRATYLLLAERGDE